ncbi:hypothetical protein SAMN06264364_101167 [Quadrisphaera granulorum]|uniref:Uncharacterized protein n=1 Tax=Quadrisphaera granulorum TaxID=317664 RepID=A0A316AF44_9ACTN|nr:hypothetical protein [Quadrisphaera granulorum]PWJ56192.1 hypothetical protein BXY45_101167 [Quadrisphaera granulorum]SZE94826.1 hypothetical protein SAMN06264364_101167 [Quadrisphaera granulorum]
MPGADVDDDDDLLVDLGSTEPEPDEPELGDPATRTGSDRGPLARTAAGIAAGAVVLVAVLLGASEVLRGPQERLEDRLSEALAGAGVELVTPVSLSDDDGDGVWTGRLRVADADGGVTGLRVALRPHSVNAGDSAAAPAREVLPLVDCESRYPLSWPGDSDTSYRTTRSDLAECVTESDGDGRITTVAWRDDDSDDGDGGGAVGRQTWRTDADGGLVWLHNGVVGGGSGDRGDSWSRTGLSGEQQRAVVRTNGLLDSL